MSALPLSEQYEQAQSVKVLLQALIEEYASSPSRAPTKEESKRRGELTDRAYGCYWACLPTLEDRSLLEDLVQLFDQVQDLAFRDLQFMKEEVQERFDVIKTLITAIVELVLKQPLARVSERKLRESVVQRSKLVSELEASFGAHKSNIAELQQAYEANECPITLPEDHSFNELEQFWQGAKRIFIRDLASVKEKLSNLPVEQ